MADDVEGCSCGMADKGAPGHDPLPCPQCGLTTHAPNECVVLPDTDDTDYSKPHQWFQYTHDAVPGNPSCSGCQLPAANERHRGRYTAVLTLHSNDLDAITEELDNILAYAERRDDDDIWLQVNYPSNDPVRKD